MINTKKKQEEQVQVSIDAVWDRSYAMLSEKEKGLVVQNERNQSKGASSIMSEQCVYVCVYIIVRTAQRTLA